MRKVWPKFLALFRQLRTQLFMAYALPFLLFLCAVLFVLFFMVQNLMIRQIGASRVDVLRQIAERANGIKNSSMSLSSLYDSDPELLTLLTMEQKEIDRTAVERRLADVKIRYAEVFHEIGSAYELVLLGANGFCYASQGHQFNFAAMQQQLWFRRLENDLHQQPESLQFVRSFSSRFMNGEDRYYFGMARQMRGEAQGSLLLLLIDEQKLQNLYEPALSAASDIYIFDKEGFIVSHSDKNMLGKQFVNPQTIQNLCGTDGFAIVKKLGEDYLLSTNFDAQTGWTIVEEMPCVNIFAPLRQAYSMILSALAVCLLIAILVSLFMATRVSKPLVALSRAMDRFGTEDFQVQKIRTGTQETDSLWDSFSHMAVVISKLMDDIHERARQKRMLEMSFLRAQINPHFLYNTLFSIRCLIEINKNAKALEMISAFTELLRMTLSVENARIPLREEMESTRKYLILQKIRYEDALQFEIDMAPDTEDCLMPPLLLQPLVENAIFHGLDAKKTPGMIVLSSALEEDRLVISISDDGLGMDGEALARVKVNFERQMPNGKDTIGLANVQKRIQLNYGEAYGLQIESSLEIGTTVNLRIPARVQKENKKEEAGDESTDRG